MRARTVRTSAHIAVVALVGVLAANASVHYAAPNGSPGGDGSLERPLDLETALSSSSPAGPGDTLYLRGGVYRKGANPHLYRSRLAGQPNAYVTVRSAPGEKASIDGGIEVLGAWSIYRDLHVFSSSALRYTSQTGPWPSEIKLTDGFSVYAPHVKLINNVIRDARLGVSSWREASSNEIYGNIIFFSGWQAPDRAHGHGIYAQNEGAAKTLAENIVFNQFRQGLQFYGSDAAPLENLVLEGNVFFNNGSLSQANEFSRNILVGGGQPAKNPVIRHNHSYFPPSAATGDNNVGYWPFGAGCEHLTLEDNRLISGGRALAMIRCTVSSLRRNLIAGPVHGFSPSEFPSNTYLPSAPTSGVEVFVRPNRYETGRAHVIVYNWERRNNVSVDVSAAGLRPGDSYELINVQNPEFDVRSGVYSGSPLTVAMTNRTVATPNGWTAPDSTFPQFGVFLLVKTSGGPDDIPPDPEEEPKEEEPPQEEEPEVPGSTETLLLEGETGLRNNIRFGHDGDASGGMYAIGQRVGGTVEFDVNVSASGQYVVWARGRATSAAAGVWTVLVDGAAQSTVSVGATDWTWNRLGGVNPASFPLSAGAHRLALRAEGFKGHLDCAVLTNDLSFTPTGADPTPPPPADTQPPTVTILSPANGSTVSGELIAQAGAADDVGVLGVRFFVDGAALGGEDATAPYRATLDADALAAGWHNLTAQARDAAGNRATSAAVRLKVEAPPEPEPEPEPEDPPTPDPDQGTYLSFEGEAGQRRDFRVGYDGEASGGMYAIGQRRGATLGFPVLIGAAADYIVWVRGRAPSAAAGRWTALIDGSPKGTVTTGSSDWVWSRPGASTPVKFRLSAGAYTLALRAEGSKGHIDVVVLASDEAFTPGDEQPAIPGAPYPSSSLIEGIDWAPASTIVRAAEGSDNWPLTWADDGHLYGAYGDGRGFEPNVPHKLSLGLARIEGGPGNFRGVNIRTSSLEQTGDGAAGKKASAILMVDGRLYLWARNADNSQLAYSDDRGRTWTWAGWRFQTSFGHPSFLNFGRDYAGARDSYVYTYSHDHSSAYSAADRMVLARVPRDRVVERRAYEFFAGLDSNGSPKWTSDIAGRKGVFEFPDGAGRSSVSYNSGLGRYLWCQVLPGADTRFEGGLGIYDAPEPWGPWTTVHFSEDWDVGPGDNCHIPTKWIQDGGETIHLVFSGDDAFSVRKGTLRVAR